MPRWPEGHTSKRKCPKCGGPKDFYAVHCRGCAEWREPLKGRKGADHPAWKGGSRLSHDGYVRTYAPDHPWPRLGGYVYEHVRVVELSIGRRLKPGEVVHHRDHNRTNNELSNLEIQGAGDHSRHHRQQDTHLRQRDIHGRFAGKEVAREAAHRR